ncbi:MAG: response regulator [Bacteroidaceae bacterium]|nr:response regulator [Bacteroidaceae bacterium]
MNPYSPCFDSIAKHFIDTAAIACYCDLKAETILVLKGEDFRETGFTRPFEKLRQDLEQFSKDSIHPEDRKILKDNLDLKNIRQQLEKSDSYTFNYRRFIDGRAVAFRSVVIRGEDSDHAVILLMDITAELKKEERITKAAREAQMLVDNLTATFNIVYIVDMSDDSLQITKMDSHMLESKGNFRVFSDARDFFLSNVVHFRDREFMTRELDFSTIRDRLAGTSSYNVEYRVIKNNVTYGGEMLVTAIEGSRIAIGMGGSDKDLVMRHMQQKRYNDYFALFVIDIDTGMLKVMKTSPWYKTGKAGEATPYTKAILDFAGTLDGEPRAFFTQLSDMEFIRRELAHEDKHAYSYKSNLVTLDTKWVNVVSYVTIRHEDGTPAEFTLGFSLVDSMESRSKETQLRLKEDMHMIGGLASGYLALYYVNIEENTCKVYSIDSERLPDTRKLLSDEVSYDTFTRFIRSDAIHPDDRQLFAGLDFNSVRQMLAHTRKCSIRFRRNYSGQYLWSEMDIIKYEDIDSPANALIIGFSEIDETVRRQEKQQEQHRRNTEIIEALASDYSSVFYVDVITGEMTPYSMNDEFGQKILEIFHSCRSFTRTYETCVRQFVYEPDQEMMLTEGDPDRIIEKLSQEKSVSLTFRRTDKGRISFCEIKFVTALKEDGVIKSLGLAMAYKDNEIMAQFLNDKLISEYISAFMVNLELDSYRTYRHPDTTRAMDREDHVWSLAMSDFAGECDPDYSELVSSIGSPAFLRSELASTSRREYLYRVPSPNKPWRRCVVLVLDRIDGIPQNVVVTFTAIDDYQSKIKDQEIQLKQQMEMIGGLASNYHALYYFNIAKKKYRLISIDEQRLPEVSHLLSNIQGNPLELFLDFGRSELVYPDDRHLFEELTVPRLFEELAHKKKFTTRFRRKFGSSFLWTELDIIKYEDIDEKPNTIVLGFAERDKEIRRELDIAVVQDLANQQRHIKMFGDMINAAMWSIVIRDDVIIAVDLSDEFRHMLGYSDEKELPNALSSWYSVLHPEDKERIVSIFWDSIHADDDGKEYNVRYRGRRKDGEFCWYHAVGRKEKINEGVRMFGIITDISADIELEMRKNQLEVNLKIISQQQEQLKEALNMAQSANRAKTTFLNNMSHDIRTPMNAIIGFTNLAAGHIDDRAKVADCLGKIDKSSNHLLSLINDVLDMSRIESGKMTLDKKQENLNDIVSSLRDIIQADIQAKGHTLYVDASGVSDNDIFCDRLRLNQVLLNILSNSIKYTPAGGTISLCISQRTVKSSGYAIYEFRIKDNGMGMSQDYLKMIFEPFMRVKSTTVSGIQGTGLGMAITKALVDMMDGQITVSSELGKGTETVITFDFRLAADNAANSGSDNDDSTAIDISGTRILLVEDNELNREIATAILEEKGCIVTPAEDGSIAVSLIGSGKNGDYDLILMDIQMPVMNGYEATRQIRLLGTPLSDIPIIAMTANAFEEDRKAALEAGMDEHIAKPINPDRLIHTIGRFLEKKH